MNSVAAVLGPLMAAQSLAWGARHHFSGITFMLTGLLMLLALAIFYLRVPAAPSRDDQLADALKAGSGE